MSWFSRKLEVQQEPEAGDGGDPLYLWLISQDSNNDYDTYSDAVVVAASRGEARKIHPNGTSGTDWDDWDWRSWTSPNDVRAVKIGLALPNRKEGEVVLASFHAG